MRGKLNMLVGSHETPLARAEATQNKQISKKTEGCCDISWSSWETLRRVPAGKDQGNRPVKGFQIDDDLVDVCNQGRAPIGQNTSHLNKSGEWRVKATALQRGWWRCSEQEASGHSPFGYQRTQRHPGHLLPALPLVSHTSSCLTNTGNHLQKPALAVAPLSALFSFSFNLTLSERINRKKKVEELGEQLDKIRMSLETRLSSAPESICQE
ncbi:hypothetical protein ASPBRDRAFT_304179 [Aspergillus brasiliensis CBS 101740]|uniref:Uncharacterized protein n=1 Tax=Aspergillus brasiliensis (strain CBS 101740 / IMI 381727 / IBT 21946) TaxID=767769 RepID=A0A1L9UA06_ASPBC|nr:hypothetical protein ASPBRDRAFT_304179 [Aspergillus brasiliensis CBS 101740]